MYCKYFLPICNFHFLNNVFEEQKVFKFYKVSLKKSLPIQGLKDILFFLLEALQL